jgi:hypothetical protein
MASEYEKELDALDLRELGEHMWLVEEIPMARIQELCDYHEIRSYKFHSAWLALLEASHSIMDKVDELAGGIQGVD